MNEWGKAMLCSAINYIARFTDDRPIMETPSPFAGREFLTGKRIETLIGRNDRSWWDFLEGSFDRKTLAKAGVRDMATFANGFPRSGTSGPNEEGILRVDTDLQAAAIDASGPEFFERCIAALQRPGEAGARARRLLARFAPEGPGLQASSDAWNAWWKANSDYLFFGEIGGYHWYLDPLAKQRGVPTARLRGPARASR